MGSQDTEEVTKPTGGRNVKSAAKTWEMDQRRRQREMIARQKASRRERVDLARKLGDQAAEDLGDDLCDMLAPQTGTDGSTHQLDGTAAEDEMQELSTPERNRSRRQQGRRGTGRDDEMYRGQLMMPDWMVAVPDRLTESWLVAARPQVFDPFFCGESIFFVSMSLVRTNCILLDTIASM